MKKVIFVFALFCGLSTTVNAQTETKKDTTKQHMAMCGEKGHTCSADCKKTTMDKKSKTALKDHVCNAACTPLEHATKCGEKGHTCTEACKKTK